MKANNDKQTAPEERLLKAIFGKAWEQSKTADDEYDENYPDTNADKIDYAAYALTKSLERISPALIRLRRLDSLYTVSRGGSELPDVIAHNEARMALKHLARAKRDIDDAYNEVMIVLERTAAKGKEE